MSPIVEPGGANMGVAEPFLDLGDIGLVLQRIGGGGGAHGMGADAVDRAWKVGEPGVMADQPIDGVGMQRFF